MNTLINTRYPYGDKVYCLSYDKLDKFISEDKSICPNTTATQWLKFSSNSLVEYLNRNTDIDWTDCKFYHDEVVVGA